MKKQVFEHTCPCNDVPFKLVYENDIPTEIFCPFCTAPIEDENELLEEVEYDLDD